MSATSNPMRGKMVGGGNQVSSAPLETGRWEPGSAQVPGMVETRFPPRCAVRKMGVRAGRRALWKPGFHRVAKPFTHDGNPTIAAGERARCRGLRFTAWCTRRAVRRAGNAKSCRDRHTGAYPTGRHSARMVRPIRRGGAVPTWKSGFHAGVAAIQGARSARHFHAGEAALGRPCRTARWPASTCQPARVETWFPRAICRPVVPGVGAQSLTPVAYTASFPCHGGFNG